MNVTLPESRLKLHCEVRGNGPVLLLVHGFPLDHTMWSGQLESLANQQQVLAPDLRGFGQSDVSPGTVSMARFADDLAELLDVLDIRNPVTICGLSMGGYIAFEFWRRHAARVERLILCDTRAAPDTPDAVQTRHRLAETVLAAGTKLIADAMVPKLFGERTLAESTDLVASSRRVMQATSPDGIAAAARGMAERADSRDLLHRIAVPTLLICGAEDRITPPEEMGDMAERLPRGELVVIEEAGHMAPLERPSVVNEAMERFLGGA